MYKVGNLLAILILMPMLILFNSDLCIGVIKNKFRDLKPQKNNCQFFMLCFIIFFRKINDDSQISQWLNSV